jgi:hypothetical protein
MKALHFPLRRHAAVFLLGAGLIGLASCRKNDPYVTEILRAADKGDLAKDPAVAQPQSEPSIQQKQ